MSEALERVITEQQARIDMLERRELLRENGLIKHHERLEQFCAAVFGFLSFPNDPKRRDDVREGLIGFNYCLRCQCAPCECDD